MAVELAKVSVLLLLFKNVGALYWYRDYSTGAAGKRYFSSSTKDLHGLEIPSVIWNMSICDDVCLRNERHVLLQVNRSLSGENWKNKWEIEMENTTINNSFHCNWYGILCDIQTKHILTIQLEENRLTGKLPVNVTNLRFLLAFRVSASTVEGKFENIVRAMPKYLLCLDLTDTKITGSIPKTIAKSIPILSKLQLSGSLVSGEIPESIGDLVHLTVLSLGETSINSNQCNGSIPQSISKLENLWFLDLETLGLNGNLSFLYNLRKLQYLHLTANKIIGTIPEDIGERCPELTELLLPNNKLSGHLPRSIGELKNLSVLNVEKNKLSGLIPKDLCGLRVRVLILSSNKFTGFENGNYTFKGLDIFRASHLPEFNCLLHTVLSYIKGSRYTIMQIDISRANLYGHLPGFVFSFARLISLKLASNRLTGPLPDPFHTMPYFTLLDLQDNDFLGPIPMRFSRLVMLTELNVKGNKRFKCSVIPFFLHFDYTMGIKERRSDTCPMVRFAHNNGTIYVDSSYYHRTYCYCNENYFGYGKYCIPCMRGGYCPGSVTRHLHSKAEKLLRVNKMEPAKAFMFLKRGYFPFPNESNVKSIHKCPSTGYYYKICAPRKYCACYISAEEKKHNIPGKIISPVNRTSIRCKKRCLCVHGHHGRYCSQCIRGYYKEGIRCNRCNPGPRKGVAFGTLFGATIASILTTVAILCISIKRLKLSVVLAIFEVALIFCLVLRHFIPLVVLQIALIIFILGFNSHLQRCTALLKSAMFYLQVMDALVSTTDIWPKSIYSIQMYVGSSFNLSFSSLACTFPSFFTLFAKSLILFLLPLVCIGMLWIIYCLFTLCKRPTKGNQSEANCKCRKYSIVIIDLAYFPLVKSCFSVLVGCRYIDGVSFMKRYVWIDCNSSEHMSLTIIAVFELIVYVIAVPLFIYLPLLLRYRNHLSDDNVEKFNWLSPLISPYRPKHRAYMEVFMLLRRLLIAIFMTSFPVNSSLQTQCITIFLLIAIIFQAIVRPFKNPTDIKCNDERYYDRLGLENGIDIFMLSCVLLSFVCIGLSAGHGNLVPSALFAIMFAINGIFIIAFCCSVLYRLLRKGSNKEEDISMRDQSECLIEGEEDCQSERSIES